MPQDGSGNYDYPLGTRGIPDETIESAAYNNFIDDLRDNDLNKPRPIHRGGTGAINADAALVNLSAEKAAQLVTPSFDAHVWYPGSFRSTNAPGQAAPVDGHAFSGICYINEPLVNPPTNANVVVSARDLNDTVVPSRVYVREKKAGLWGDWTVIDATTLPFPPGGGIAGDTIIEAIQELDADKADKTYVDTQDATKVAKSGGADGVMTGYLTLSNDPTAPMHPATKSYVDNLIISGIDVNRNRLVNPAMQIAQDATFVGVDMFRVDATTTGVIAVTKVTSPPSPKGGARLRVSVTTIDATLAAGEFLTIRQGIEDINTAGFAFGTASAKPMVLRFGWKSPAGVYSMALRNANQNRTFVKNFTVSAGQANTDIEIVATFPGDITGDWSNHATSKLSLNLNFCMAAGSSSIASTSDAWFAMPAAGFASISNTNGLGAIGVFELFDVGLYVDIAGTGVPPPFVVPDPTTELLRCQRYYYKASYTYAVSFTAAGTGQIIENHPVRMTKMQSPQFTLSGVSYPGGVASNLVFTGVGVDAFVLTFTTTIGVASILYTAEVKARI